VVSEHLLQTKLQIPRRRTPAVARPRLIERLDIGFESRLILVSAPAGFGKTTLLTEWLASNRYPSTWLSLDEHDNELALFLAYFFASLQRVKASLSEAAPGLFNPPEQFLLPSTLINLLNEVNSITDHFILVIDDYHVIKNQDVHKALAFLIDNLPANMHLVIASRADPPLNLANLRGRGQLTELRANDLRFTSKEIADYLNRVMELDLNDEELSLLDIRIEGWIAGLQMAAITLKGRTDLVGFVRALSISRRNILDYLFEEVFEQQSEDVRTFLLTTSILDRLNPSLCDAVTEHRDSDRILDKIERASLFIFPLDEELRWFHYHPLFRDLLQHNLSIAYPDMMPVLHRRASEWYEREDLIVMAIGHALEAKDYDRAASLIERRAGEIMAHGEYTTYLGWMESFPQSIIGTYPILMVHRTLAETVVGGLPLEDVEARLQQVEKLDPQNNLVKGAGLVVRAVALGNQTDLSQNAELCRKALELVPPESTLWHGLATLGLRQFWLMQGGVPATSAAIGLYNEAIEMGQKIGIAFVTVVAQRRLAEAFIAAGRLHEARRCYQGILDMAVDRRGQPLPIASFGLFGLGVLNREWNDLEKAQSYLEKGITLEGGKLGRWQVDGIIELARTRQAMGDMEGASHYLRKARLLLTRFPKYSKSHESIISAYETALAMARGEIETVSIWANELDQAGLASSFEIGGEFPLYVHQYSAHELQLLTLARAHLAQNKPAEAMKLLDTLSSAAQKLGRTGIVLEAHVLSAVACKTMGRIDDALGHFREALHAAQPEGYIRLFLDAGPDVSSLLYEAVRQGITPAYAHRLMAAFPVVETTPSRPGKSTKLVDPISDRELAVLKLLDQGLSNKEIGQRLHIETRTVKWHTSNIFGKMGVKNRIQAVARARGLGIIRAESDPHDKTD
jgi:LuxR family transcriptional regulator, maltose regulon positive regulatory protein